uniref:Integrase catalytic domain-containing protein n=1 Tax=Tanacetum cinerariifolium TaxID=118510 RepID=A0A699HIT6_TANCI|nr:hypothetical protein [Tanacetum cinerariifolium]
MSTSNTLTNSNQQTLVDSGANERPSMHEKGNYIPWESRFRRFLDNKLKDRERMWNSIQNGPYQRPMVVDPTNLTVPILEPLSKMTKDEFVKFAAKEGESLDSVHERLTTLVNIMDHNNVRPIPVAINTKFLNCLQPEWSKYVTMVRYNQTGSVVSYDVLYDQLVQFEPHVLASRAKKATNNHDHLALIAHSNAPSLHSHAKSSYSSQPYYVTHPSSVINYDDDYQWELQGNSQEDKLTTAMMMVELTYKPRMHVMVKMLTTMQGETELKGLIQEMQCYNYNEKGHYARECQKPKVCDSKYFREQMLLAMKDEAGSNLGNEENDFMLDTSYREELEELTATVMLMAQIQPADKNAMTVPSYDATAVSSVKRALFTSPVPAKSKSLGATSVVAKSRFGVAKTQTATNKVIQLVLWIVDSECSKHMTGNLKLLRNFIEKFMGTVRFGNDHFTAIIGYGDYVQGNLTICHAYYVEGLGHNMFLVEQFCDGYLEGKNKKASLSPKLVPNTESKLRLLHMDLCGPMRVSSINGKKYILVIVDDYSRFTWVYFLRTKDEAPDMIIDFVNQVQKNLKASILMIRTDNGTEFKNEKLRLLYAKLGIVHKTSIARTPLQNGVVEIRNRTLVENRSIVHTRYNKNPYELIRGRKPNVQYFHVFGSLCYPTNDRDDLGKMKPKADIDLDNLFGPMYEEYYVTSSQEVSDNFAANTLDNDHTSSSSSIVIDQDDAPPIVVSSKEQVVTEPNSSVLNEVADEFVQEDIADFNGNMFHNAPQTPKFNDFGSELIAYEDADHAGCNDDFKSTSEGIQFLGDKLVNWSSKKQDYTAMSSAEAEYVSLSACCAQVNWMRT